MAQAYRWIAASWLAANGESGREMQMAMRRVDGASRWSISSITGQALLGGQASTSAYCRRIAAGQGHRLTLQDRPESHLIADEGTVCRRQFGSFQQNNDRTNEPTRGRFQAQAEHARVCRQLLGSSTSRRRSRWTMLSPLSALRSIAQVTLNADQSTESLCSDPPHLQQVILGPTDRTALIGFFRPCQGTGNPPPEPLKVVNSTMC